MSEQFAVGAGQVTAVLRLPLVGLMTFIGTVVDEPHLNAGVYRAVLAAFAVWSLGVAWWMFHRPVPGWASWVTTAVDLAALVALSAVSNGATSYLQPIFFLYPVAVAFQYRPALTATVGVLIAGSYVAIWLGHLGRDGGPSIPGVVWLHFGLLLWLATATTALTTVLVRRSAGVLELLAVQQQLTAGSLAIAQRERALIAEDLHDGPLQNVIATRRNLEQLAAMLPGNPLLAQSDGLLKDTANGLRGTVSVLHPQVLAQLGLTPALTQLAGQYAQRTGLRVHTDLADIGQVGSQDLLYSTARELLTNTARHAQATQVWVGLSRTAGRVRLCVEDDGTGFNPAVITDRVSAGHIGLAAHTVRIADADGHLTITPRHPHGTSIAVDIPG